MDDGSERMMGGVGGLTDKSKALRVTL